MAPTIAPGEGLLAPAEAETRRSDGPPPREGRYHLYRGWWWNEAMVDRRRFDVESGTFRLALSNEWPWDEVAEAIVWQDAKGAYPLHDLEPRA